MSWAVGIAIAVVVFTVLYAVVKRGEREYYRRQRDSVKRRMRRLEKAREEEGEEED